MHSNQLNYRNLLRGQDLNLRKLRPPGYEPNKLPELLYPAIIEIIKLMEEEEGFEPPRGLTRLSVFKTDPFSQTWVFLQKDVDMVDLVGLEPTTGRL